MNQLIGHTIEKAQKTIPLEYNIIILLKYIYCSYSDHFRQPAGASGRSKSVESLKSVESKENRWENIEVQKG